MKKIALVLIGFYQKFLSIFLKMTLGTTHFCRYNPTCSDYAKHAIVQYGLIKGGFLSTVRILSCQPISINRTRQKIRYYFRKLEDKE